MRQPPSPLTLRPTWLRVCLLAVCALGFSVWVWWPALAALPNTQAGDGPPYHKTLEAARVSVTRYHELPMWNPYECGGLPLWDNPQAPIGAPLVWPMFVIGTTATMALWYVLHTALGFVCMWLLARHELRLGRLAAAVASVGWAAAGFHQQHYSGGHFTFVPFLYFPLGLLLWRRAEGDDRFAVGLGVLVSWMIYEGGVYPLPHLAVILAFETLFRTVPVRRVRAIARAGAIVMVVGFALGACRFLPVMEQLRAHKRALGTETDALHWATLKDMFLARDHQRFVADQAYVWPEYGAYLGPLLLVLAIVGVLACGLENAWLLALLLFSFALMVGHASHWAPWSVLKRHVFPFKEMRVPSRFRLEVTLFLMCFAGLAVERLGARVRGLFARGGLGDAARSLVAAVGLLGAGDVASVAYAAHSGAFTSAPEDPNVVTSPKLYYGFDDAGMIDQPRQNRGRTTCWDEWGFGQGAPLWYGDVPQARAAEGAEATVLSVTRTQNTFLLDVAARAPSRILINSTWDVAWRTNVGVVGEAQKQLVLDVPAGRHQVKLRYLPRTFWPGVWLGVLCVIGLASWAYVRRRTRRPANEPPNGKEDVV